MKSYRIKTPIGTHLNLELDEESISLSGFGRKLRLAWRDFIQAGFSLKSQKHEELLQEKNKGILPPGFGYVLKFINHSIEIYAIYRNKHGKMKIFLLMLSEDEQHKDSILSDFKRYLKDRWHENTDSKQIRKMAGYRYNLISVSIGVIFVFALSIVILFGWWAIFYYYQEFDFFHWIESQISS